MMTAIKLITRFIQLACSRLDLAAALAETEDTLDYYCEALDQRRLELGKAYVDYQDIKSQLNRVSEGCNRLDFEYRVLTHKHTEQTIAHYKLLADHKKSCDLQKYLYAVVKDAYEALDAKDKRVQELERQLREQKERTELAESRLELYRSLLHDRESIV